MSNLFGNEPVPEKSLKITTGAKKALSKKQQSFNRLTNQIEKLQSEIKRDQAKLDNILKAHTNVLVPVETENAKNKVMLARVMTGTTATYKYGKKQVQELGKTVCELLRQAFGHIEPDEETVALFDQWSGTSYQELVDTEIQKTKDMFSDLMYENFGVDVDLSEVGNSPGEIARFAKKMQDELLDKSFGENTGKKTKKQLEQEARGKAENDIKLKSIRNIYIGLAKILHPDTEGDPHLRAEKEELMKKVTVAYDEKDLSTLLKLEMQWANRESLHLDNLPDAKLDIYISFLKEQVDDLRDEQEMLYNHPRYMAIQDYMDCPEREAQYLINDRAAKTKANTAQIIESISDFTQPGSKKEIMAFVKFFNELVDAMDTYREVFA